jgi:hypothetical protein
VPTVISSERACPLATCPASDLMAETRTWQDARVRKGVRWREDVHVC